MAFDSEYEKLCEGYGRIKETTFKLFPRNLKGKLSEQFVKALNEEYFRLTRPQQVIDEETGQERSVYPDKKKVLSELQKALPFLVRK